MPDSDILAQWAELLGQGLLGTAKLSLISIVLTIMVGAGLAVLAVSQNIIVRGLVRAWIELLRSIPTLALLILLYFGLGPVAARFGINAFAIAVLSLTLSMSAYQAEVFRGAIRGVPKTQWGAATSLGMRHGQTLRLIVIPQVIAPLVPAVVNIIIGVIKLSSLASLITVSELALAGTQAVSLSFYPLQVYVLVGLCYAAIIVPLIYFSRWLEKWTQRRFGLTSAAIDRKLIGNYTDAKTEAQLAAAEGRAR